VPRRNPQNTAYHHPRRQNTPGNGGISLKDHPIRKNSLNSLALNPALPPLIQDLLILTVVPFHHHHGVDPPSLKGIQVNYNLIWRMNIGSGLILKDKD